MIVVGGGVKLGLIGDGVTVGTGVGLGSKLKYTQLVLAIRIISVTILTTKNLIFILIPFDSLSQHSQLYLRL